MRCPRVIPGRPARTRTWNLRIWSPLLCLLSYRPAPLRDPGNLLGFPVQSMLTTSWTIFTKLQTIWVVVPILLGCVIPPLAFCACQRNYDPNLFRHSRLNRMLRIEEDIRLERQGRTAGLAPTRLFFLTLPEPRPSVQPGRIHGSGGSTLHPLPAAHLDILTSPIPEGRNP